MEITFKDIVKLIHPDTNPNIQDASGKMTLVMKYKTNVMTLWNLALRWGLVQGEYNISSPESPRVLKPTPNKGWGYNRTNPAWTPTSSGWDTNNYSRPNPTPPPRPVREKVKYIKVFDIVIMGDIEGVVMKITPVLYKYDVEVLTSSGIVKKIVTNLRSSETVKKIRKASKRRINDSQMMYDLLRRG